MEAVVIVTVLVLAQYIYFGIQVGSFRAKTGVKAPAMAGDEMFERMNRVHQNTLEQIVVILPALWLYAHIVQKPYWGAVMAAVYLVGRFLYKMAYLKDPKSRSLGFMLSFLPSAVMLIWVLVIAVKTHFV